MTKYLFTAVLLTQTCLTHALPFSIVPTQGSALPTQLTPNQTTTALYTIVNNTASPRSGNTLYYLPPNVSQITSNSSYPDLCGASFTLQPHNTSGDSCTLQLLISGAVNGQDLNPSHHLFACFPGGKTCAGTRSPLNVNIISGTPVVAAVGSYFNQDGTVPIDVQTSTDNGSTWTQQNVPLLSTAGYSLATLQGVDCTDNACVGAGYYGDGVGNSSASVAASTDNGQSWFQQVLTAPTGFSQGQLAGITCQDHTCTAVGSYQDNTTSSTQSAVATTTNTGATWTQQVLPLPTGLDSSQMNGVTCTGSTCIGVGSLGRVSPYLNTMAVFTNTNGAGWSVGQVLDDTKNGTLNGVSCSSAACIAAGYSSSGAPIVGTVFVSTNQGNTWTQQPDLVFTNFSQGLLSAVSCTDSFCVTVGAAINGSLSNFPWYPAVAVGNADGTGWSTDVLPIVAGYGGCQFKGVNCKGTTCIAAGACCLNNQGSCDLPFPNSVPFIAISQDSGQTWSEQISTLPTGSLGGGYNAVG